MDILKLISDELDSDTVDIMILLVAFRYVEICEHFKLDTPDWLRALANGNPEHFDDLILFCRKEKAGGV